MHNASEAAIEQLLASSGGESEVDHLWFIDEHEPGSVLPAGPIVTAEPNQIHYTDLYSNGSLMLYVPATGSYSAAHAHRYLALDSNMFEGLKRYVLDGERDTKHVTGIEQLIDYATVQGYSILPTPYLLENIVYRGFDAAQPYCQQIVEVVLKLCYLDGATFRACRQFLYSEFALDNLEGRFGTRNIKTAAETRAEELLKDQVLIRAHYYMSYLTVLALVAIGLEFEDRETRVSAFDDLLIERIGRVYPRYMLLARLYYYDKISRWMGSPPGSATYTVNTIRAAAYDISLTMLNEELLHTSDPSDPDVVMLVTRDKQLAKNAPIIGLRGMSLLKNGEIRVLNPWNEPLVDQIFGQNAERIRSEIDERIRQMRLFEIRPLALLGIIRDYECKLGVPHAVLSSLEF